VIASCFLAVILGYPHYPQNHYPPKVDEKPRKIKAFQKLCTTYPQSYPQFRRVIHSNVDNPIFTQKCEKTHNHDYIIEGRKKE